MVGVKVSTTITADEATPMLTATIAGLRDRTELNRFVADEVEMLTFAHVSQLALTRHTTADRLGAKPTGHLEDAARSIESQATRNAAVLAFARASGLQRAWRSILIKPGPDKKALAIPVHADSYGVRAGDMKDLVLLKLGPRNTAVLARRVDGSKFLETLYLLLPQVLQKQDPSLMPTDDEYHAAVNTGAREWFRAKVEKNRAALAGTPDGKEARS